MKRLLPDFFRSQTDHPAGSGATDSLNSALRSLHEPEIIAAKREAAQRVLETVPNGGGRFELTEDDAHAWAAAVNDVRLALGHHARHRPGGARPAAARPPDGRAFRRVPMAHRAAGVPRPGLDRTRDERDHRCRRDPRRPTRTDRCQCHSRLRLGERHDGRAHPAGHRRRGRRPGWRARYAGDRPARSDQLRAPRRRRRAHRRQRLRTRGGRRRDALARGARAAGWRWTGGVVPIVPAAVVFDLPVGGWDCRPTAEFGYAAAESAGSRGGRSARSAPGPARASA